MRRDQSNLSNSGEKQSCNQPYAYMYVRLPKITVIVIITNNQAHLFYV